MRTRLRLMLPLLLLLLLLLVVLLLLVLLLLLLMPLLRGPKGERNGDVVVCSRTRSAMGNMIRTGGGGGEDETRRHTEAHSERAAGKRRA
jgi:hypothetical protein